MVSESETAEKEKPAEQPISSGRPNAYRVGDDKNLEEKDLKRAYLFGHAKMKNANDPGMEGQGMGGHSFGEDNLTPAGSDEANSPEDENFTLHDKDSGPGSETSEVNIPGPQELPDQQKVGYKRG